MDFTTVFGDSTHQKANANKRKCFKKEVKIIRKKYEEDLLKEINEEREWIDKPFFESIQKTEYVNDEQTGKERQIKNTKTTSISTTNPESRCFHKEEKVI